MRGADPVNDEFEVGFDQSFEQGWRRAEQVGRIVMIVFVAAGLAGLFGRGPYSHRTEKTAESGLAVDFEPVARSQTSTQVTLHIANPTEAPAREVFVGSNIVEPMGLERIIPAPIAIKSVDGGMKVLLPIQPGTKDAEIRFVLQPVSLGANELIAKLDGQPPLRWTQFVVP